MIISDLSFVESLAVVESLSTIEKSTAARIEGGDTGIAVSSQVFAFGEFTSTVTDGKAWAFSTPYGSIALGYTLGGGLGYTPPEGSTLIDWQAWLTQY
jgi:hypothetical protein